MALVEATDLKSGTSLQKLPEVRSVRSTKRLLWPREYYFPLSALWRIRS